MDMNSASEPRLGQKNCSVSSRKCVCGYSISSPINLRLTRDNYNSFRSVNLILSNPCLPPPAFLQRKFALALQYFYLGPAAAIIQKGWWGTSFSAARGNFPHKRILAFSVLSFVAASLPINLMAFLHPYR